MIIKNYQVFIYGDTKIIFNYILYIMMCECLRNKIYLFLNDSDPTINKIELINLILSTQTDIRVKKDLFDILNAMNVENISIKNFLLLLMSKKDP